MPTLREFTFYDNLGGTREDKTLVDVDRIVSVAREYRLDDKFMRILDNPYTVITLDFDGSTTRVKESPGEVLSVVEEAKKSSTLLQSQEKDAVRYEAHRIRSRLSFWAAVIVLEVAILGAFLLSWGL